MILRFIVMLLVVVGAINWGLWGFFQYDLVASLLGGQSAPLARLVYAIVGIAGIWAISFFPAVCKSSSCCSGESSSSHNDKNHGDS